MTEFYAHHGFWLWAAAGALLLAVEVAFGSGYLLWAAASAGIVSVFILTGMSPGLPVELTLFAALTIVSSLIAHRFFPPTAFDGPDINDQHHRLIGHRGHVVGTFRGGVGRVFVDGKEWAAESDDRLDDLADGDRIAVVSVKDGAALTVRRSA